MLNLSLINQCISLVSVCLSVCPVSHTHRKLCAQDPIRNSNWFTRRQHWYGRSTLWLERTVHKYTCFVSSTLLSMASQWNHQLEFITS